MYEGRAGEYKSCVELSMMLSDLRVYLALAGSPAGGSVTVTLYGDSTSCSNSPHCPNLTNSQPIGTVSDSNVASTGGITDLPVNPGISLSANTRYWIGMSSGSSQIEWAYTGSVAGTGDISSEYYCYYQSSSRPTAVPGRPQPRSAADSLVCYANSTEDPFIMQVTVSSSAATVPALSFAGIVALTLLLAASAVLFLRRSQRAVN